MIEDNILPLVLNLECHVKSLSNEADHDKVALLLSLLQTFKDVLADLGTVYTIISCYIYQ